MIESTAKNSPAQHEKETLRTKIREGLKYVFLEDNKLKTSKGQRLNLHDIDQVTMTYVMNSVSTLRDFGTAVKVLKILDDRRSSIPQIINLIKTDPVLSTRILRTASSAYLGRQLIDSIDYAVVLLGLDSIKHIVYYETLVQLTSRGKLLKSSVLEMLWEHSVITSICTKYIADAFEGLNVKTLTTIGLVHDIGKFVLTDLFPLKQREHDHTIPYTSQFDIFDEDEIFRINHPIIAELAFKQWGLSEVVIKVVAAHHDPELFDLDRIGITNRTNLNYVLALFLSNQIAKLLASEKYNDVFKVECLDHSYHKFVDKSKIESLLADDYIIDETLSAKSLMALYITLPRNWTGQ